MWGLEQLWPEGLLWGLGLSVGVRGGGLLRAGGVVALLLYALSLEWVAGGTLWHTHDWAYRLLCGFLVLTALSWWWAPPSREGGIALFLQVGAYSLLLRSTHLVLTWAMMEVAAIAGYFVIVALGTERWATALRYFIWNVTGSALILLGLAMRLSEGARLAYPLASASWLSDNLLGWGWAVKVGLIPWHSWIVMVYRRLPPLWAGWFSAVPKGALLGNLLYLFPDQGICLDRTVFWGLSAVTLVSAYAWAWRSAKPLEIIFWGSLAQGAFLALVLGPGGQERGWFFWMVYGVASWLAFSYGAQPWRGRWGDAVGILLLANLAALPPVLGFWVKLGLFEWAFAQPATPWKPILLLSGALALLGGLFSYGKALWLFWRMPQAAEVPYGLRIVQGAGAFLLLGLGFLGFSGMWG